MEGPKERRAEIHPKIWRGRSIFLLDRSPCEPLGQRRQYGRSHGDELTGIVRPQEGFPDVLNHAVLLGRRVLVLRHHLPIAVGQSVKHGLRIGTILEHTFGEAQRGRKRSRCLPGPVTGDAQRVVEGLALGQSAIIPTGHHRRMVGRFQWLHPSMAHGHSIGGFDDRTIGGIPRLVDEISSSHGRSGRILQRTHFGFRESAPPQSQAFHATAAQVASEVGSGPTHLENLTGGIRLRKIRPVRDLAAIEPNPCSPGQHAENGHMGFPIIHPRAAAQGSQPTDVIHQMAVPDEQRLGTGLPFSMGRTNGEESARSLGLKLHPGRHILPEGNARGWEIKTTASAQSWNLFRTSDQQAIAPNTENRRPLCGMLHRDVLSNRSAERKTPFLAPSNHTSGFFRELDMKPVAARPLRRFHREGMPRRSRGQGWDHRNPGKRDHPN